MTLKTSLVLAAATLLVAGCGMTQAQFRTAGIVVAGAELTCDAGQSAWMADGGKFDRVIPDTYGYNEVGKLVPLHFQETNPILGEYPSAARTDVYLAGIEGGLIALNASGAPEWVKDVAIATVIAVEAGAVNLNHSEFQGTAERFCGM